MKQDYVTTCKQYSLGESSPGSLCPDRLDSHGRNRDDGYVEPCSRIDVVWKNIRGK